MTVYEFDRYINGRLMAEGVTVENADALEKAAEIAARIASRGPHGEAPVLVLRPSPVDKTMGVKLDGPELWEIVFGVLQGDVPEQLTGGVLSKIASAINAVFIDPARTAAAQQRGERIATLPPVDQTAAPLGEFRDEAERKEFHAWIEAGKPKVWPPAKETAVGDDAVKDAVAILQTAVTGNCDRKNRHGYGDCGAEGIIARALAVLRGEATPE